MRHKNWQSVFSILMLVGLLTSMVTPVSAKGMAAPLNPVQPKQEGATLSPTVITPVKADVLPALKDVKPKTPVESKEEIEIPQLEMPKSSAAVQGERFTDATLQSKASNPNVPAPLINFEAVNKGLALAG